MNNCTFTGYLAEIPYTQNVDGVAYTTFKMVTYNYVKNKYGQKKRYPTTLTFEAWHTGAETIAKLAEKGAKMTVYASAKNGEHQTIDSDDIRFRVNEFDFGCLDKE